MYDNISESIKQLIEYEIRSNLSIVVDKTDDFKKYIYLTYRGIPVGGQIPFEL